MAEDQFVSPDEKPYSPQEMPEEGDLGALEVAPEELSSFEQQKAQRAQEFAEQEQAFFESQPRPEALAGYQTAMENDAAMSDEDQEDFLSDIDATVEANKQENTKRAFFWGTLLYLPVFLTPFAVKSLAKPLIAHPTSGVFKTFNVPIMNTSLSDQYAPYSKFHKGIAMALIKAAPYYIAIILIILAIIVIVSVIRVYCANMTVWDKILNITAWYACSQITD